MRAKRQTASLLAVLLFLAVGRADAQQIQVQIPAAGTVQELVIRGGSTLYGRVVTEADPFRFELLSGQTMEIQVADVVRLRATQGRVVNGRFWREDPNETRLFFGPTARMVKRGEGYLSVFELFLPFVALGVHDRFTLAGGTLLLFGTGSQPFWFAPKVGLVQTENVAVAAGVLAFFTTDFSESLGILYGVASTGGADGGFHVGLGYGYANGDLASHPAVMVGMEKRVSSGVKLLSENYLFPEEGGILSGGVRFFGERLSADVGLAVPLFGGEGFIAFPVVNFVWNW